MSEIERFLERSRETLRLSGFRKFILRGNVIDLAIGVVIGAAFTAVVNGLVNDFLTPLINIPLGNNKDFAKQFFKVSGSKFYYGDFINRVLTLALIGFALYYFVVLPVNALMERYKPTAEEPVPTKDCPECLSSIPAAARKCAFCASPQAA